MDRVDLTVTQVTDFVLKLQIVFWIVDISETMMSTDDKTQKESYASRSAVIYYYYLFIYLFFFFALKMSVAE